MTAKVAGYFIPKHAHHRMRERGFGIDEVRDALERPEHRYVQRRGKYKRNKGEGTPVVYQGPAVAVAVVEDIASPLITTVVYRHPQWWRHHLRVEAEIAIGEWADRIFRL